jgi:hypothetical protein
MTALGWIALVLIIVPPIAFFVSLFMAAELGRAKWRGRAWVFGVLSLGSVALLAFFIYALKHLD